MSRLGTSVVLAALLIVALTTREAKATVPYGSLSGGIPGVFGPGLPMPSIVPGKEYSHDVDQNTTGVGGVADPEQVIAWDGSGGTADGVDYGGEGQVDAIANQLDLLFDRLIGPDPADEAHLIFSHDDMISVYPAAGGGFGPYAVPAAGPIVLATGKTIGGAGELSYELAGAHAAPATLGVWATQPDINGMPAPRDVDGVEVWGPEPPLTADADRYSLDLDFTTGTSVFSDPGAVPYISHGTIVAAVTAALGAPPSGVLPFPTFIDGDDAVNLDALMVQNNVGEPETFDRNPDGGVGDRIIFSIRQIVDTSDPSGYYATGSELFVMDASLGPAGTTFLYHGGHLWDKAYALSDLALSPDMINGGRAVIDINAIEAVSETVVPEPASIGLAVVSALGIGVATRRRRGR